MRHFLPRVLGAILLTNAVLNAQTANSLSAVQFVDANTVVAVGDAGTILRSNDGGVTWTNQSSGTTANLIGVSFANASAGGVVGALQFFLNFSPVILHTTDAGASWQTQLSPSQKILTDVAFVDPQRGFIVGYSGTILRTTNGGNTWELLSSGVTENLLSVDFIDANTGTATGTWGRILRTTDGGNTWVSQPSGTNNFMSAVDMVSATTIFIAANTGLIYRSTNGGATWTAYQTPATTSNLQGITFADANNGWAVGWYGTIIRTTNGGNTWSLQSSGTTNDLFGVAFKDANTGVAVGSNGVILRTTNGGATWGPPSGGGGGTSPPAAPTLSSPGNGATGQPTTLTLSWNASSGASTYRLQVSTSSSFGSTVYDNASLTGTSQSVGPLASNTTYYWHVSASNSAGTSAYSDTWSFTTNGGGPLFSVTPTSINFGTVPTKSTKIDSVTVSNGGTSTLSISSIVSSSSSFGVSPTSATVAPGASQKIYISFTPKNKNRVSATITFTHNAPGSPNSVSVSGIGSSTPKGQGPKKLAVAELDEVILDQNYPNPFNPSTVIAYYLPEESIVNLTVYNIIGQEVTTLVNQVVDAGYHSTIWNAANINGLPLPSGIYIYRLHATTLSSGEVFTEFRKMYLLK